jgi:DNA-binding NtrC family response regulator
MRGLKLQKKGGNNMAKRLTLDLELPDELLAQFQESEMAAKAREALIMALLREHRLSQGKAADVLGLDRHGLFDLMTRYHIPAIDLTPEELKRELEKPLSRS